MKKAEIEEKHWTDSLPFANRHFTIDILPCGAIPKYGVNDAGMVQMIILTSDGKTTKVTKEEIIVPMFEISAKGETKEAAKKKLIQIVEKKAKKFREAILAKLTPASFKRKGGPSRFALITRPMYTILGIQPMVAITEIGMAWLCPPQKDDEPTFFDFT